MKNKLLTLFLLAISTILIAQDVSKVDPYHTESGGFGYLVNSDATCAVWWAEGAYKVLRDTPIPEKKNNRVKLWSAKNEYESFQVVAKPSKRMDNFRINVSELKNDKGNAIRSDHITIRKVSYVEVTKSTDSYGFEGWWPDPLPVYKKAETIFAEENQPFWITVKVPSSALPGIYTGNLILSSGAWDLTVPVELEVWDFVLPDSSTMRSGLGMSMGNVKEYDNITRKEDEMQVFEYYMESFRDYKISPYNPFEYSPIKENVKGVAWEGGFFDSQDKYAGTYSYKLVDESASSNSEGFTRQLIPVNNVEPYQLTWYSKSLVQDQRYVVGVECYDVDKEFVIYENRFDVFKSQEDWSQQNLNLGTFDNEIKYIKIRLFPSNRTLTGEEKGTVWFDELSLINTVSEKNEFEAGNFEVDLSDIDIKLDFEDFNKAGKRYFDEFGFNGYRLRLKGLGGGNYYSRRKGVFEGFEQGTDEYNKLMEGYLSQMQANLEKQGWLGKEYIYWFDEPGEKDYPFVKETNALIKKYAPKITTFLTEHVAGQDISDVTDISCTIWHKLDHDKIRNMNKNGLEHWSYLCCWPKSPWISEFIDHDAINLRMWLWASYQHQLKGILIWQTTYWDSNAASPEGYLQNPWEQAMSFVRGYGWPLGKQTIWGNGDGRLFYPVNRDPNNDSKTYVDRPVPSLRLEILRDGIEDYEYFVMLTIPETIYTNETTYSKNPLDIINYRKQLAEYILLLSK